MVDGRVLEFENAHVAVGGCGGEEAAGLMGGPGYHVDRGLVLGELVDALPLIVLALLLPDEYLAVVAG